MIRKVSSLFVFILTLSIAHSQYSVESFITEVAFEYEEITNITESDLVADFGTLRFPVPVLDFMNCDDIYGVDELTLHSMDGELMYRSGDPSENINLKNIPVALYMLTIHYESGLKRNLFLQRMNLSE